MLQAQTFDFKDSMRGVQIELFTGRYTWWLYPNDSDWSRA